MPDPILVGRNPDKIAALARAHGVTRWGTDLAAALPIPTTVFFDAGTTQMRPALLEKAIARRQACLLREADRDRPAEAVEIARLARESGLKHGVVQDKLFLPGLRKLKMLSDSGFFGRLLAVRIEFGYWVFEGDLQPASARPGTTAPRTAAASSST
jgi:predicted dehydrogenase